MSGKAGWALRAEVTVALAILRPDRRILGQNVVDATFAFEAPAAAPPPRELADPEINAVLAHQISRVLAAIRVLMPQVGLYELEGTVDEPMTGRSHEVGKGLTDPITVHLDLTPDARA